MKPELVIIFFYSKHLWFDIGWFDWWRCVADGYVTMYSPIGCVMISARHSPTRTPMVPGHPCSFVVAMAACLFHSLATFSLTLMGWLDAAGSLVRFLMFSDATY